MYDTTQGRFLQRDPLEYGDGMGLYEYAMSRPMSLKDPLGSTVTCWIPLAGEFTFGMGASLSLSYCSDECDNWAWVFTPSARVGAQVGLTLLLGGSAADGCLKDWIEGNSWDVTGSALIFSGGVDYESKKGKWGGHGGVGPGVPQLKAGLSAGYNFSQVIKGDLKHDCPCEEKFCEREQRKRMGERIKELESEKAKIQRLIEGDKLARYYYDRKSLSPDEQSRLNRRYGLDNPGSLLQLEAPGGVFLGRYTGPLPMMPAKRAETNKALGDTASELEKLRKLFQMR